MSARNHFSAPLMGLLFLCISGPSLASSQPLPQEALNRERRADQKGEGKRLSRGGRREGQSRGRRDKLEARGKIAKEPQFLWDLFYIPLIIFGRMGSGSTIITSTQLLSLGGKSFIGLVIITP